MSSRQVLFLFSLICSYALITPEWKPSKRWFMKKFNRLDSKIKQISKVVDGHGTKLYSVAQDVANLKASDLEQQTEIESLSTNGKWCAWNYGAWTTVGTIKYQKLTFSDSNNMEITGTPMDINSGIYS